MHEVGVRRALGRELRRPPVHRVQDPQQARADDGPAVPPEVHGADQESCG